MSQKRFNLINITPIGMIKDVYPETYCNICNGHLSDRCGRCIDSNTRVCKIVCNNDKYYHRHCYYLLS